MADRIWFEGIDSVGTFRSGDVRLDVKFRDSDGNEYMWIPEWDDLSDLYAEAERVEELNIGEGYWLDELKKRKQFDDETLHHIAEIIADTWTGDDLNRFFETLDFDIEWDDTTEAAISEYAGLNPIKASMEGMDSESKRRETVVEKLEELNEEDYRYVVQVISKAAHPRTHIGEEDRHSEVVDQLNQILEFEYMKVTEEGEVLPMDYDGVGSE